MTKPKIELTERTGKIHADITFASGKSMRVTFYDEQDMAEITNIDRGTLVVQPVVSNQIKVKILND